MKTTILSLRRSAQQEERRRIAQELHDNQPARAESSSCRDDSANYELVVIWSSIFLSFAAFFIAGCIIWIKCHGDFPH